MKRSRIICSIITVIYIILSIALCLIILKSNVTIESSIGAHIKAIHIGAFGVCTLMYVGVRNKLAKKMSNKTISIKISKIYCYVYLAVIVFVSRLVMAYILKDSVPTILRPCYSMGIGSYVNYSLAQLIGNQMYANIILNSILVYLAGIVIKKIVLNITDNDMVATTTSIIYILAPQSLAFVSEYIKYNYNVILVLVGIFVFLHIIDEVKQFNKRDNKYLIYAGILGVTQSLDIVFGGSYMLWLCTMLIITTVAMYVDVVHIKIKFKNSLNYKFKRIAEKIEKINISKLIYITAISLLISLVPTVLNATLSNSNNYQMFEVINVINILLHSRNYYLVLIIFAFVFEIISVIASRKMDIKMYLLKLLFICEICLLFFMVDGIYAAGVFDTLLILNAVMNICNICYNREERIKLLKEKN